MTLFHHIQYKMMAVSNRCPVLKSELVQFSYVFIQGNEIIIAAL